MIKKEIALVCKSVWYYSECDETVFFDWIKKIPSIINYHGVGDELYLYVKSKKIHDEDLKEIIALFYRYKIEMKQLEIFINDQNKAWFYSNKKAYWHRRIFGTSK